MKTLITAGLVILKDRKLLLAFSNNKKAFYLPGGKTDQGETTAEALVREIREELNVSLDPGALRFYTHVEALAYGEKEDTLMKQDCFRAELPAMPRPAAEIGDLRYFDTHHYRLEPEQVPGVITVMLQLKKDDLID
ncbi:MAG TPA: NUDIX domain-containing protein [Puia sp.]|nr:NUDIX domain-containing protein [Puia sp.]